MVCCAVRNTGPEVIDPPDPPGVAGVHFQIDTTTTILTSSITFVTMVTIATPLTPLGAFKILNGAEWNIDMGVLICCPYATAGMGVNGVTKWQIETSSGVFTDFDEYSVDEHITIVGNEKSSPRSRNKNLIASMDGPRMRIQVRRSSAGATGFFWEDGRWGGSEIKAP